MIGKGGVMLLSEGVERSRRSGLGAAHKKGSSRFTGKCCFYLQKEVVVIPVAVGHPLDHLDLVVHSLQHTGVQPVDRAGDNAVDVALEAPMVDGLDRMPMQP